MAAGMPLVALRGAHLRFGDLSVFDGLTLTLEKGEHSCLVGRNGSGKSTLLKVLAGQQELDQGERFVQPGSGIVYLPQDPDLGGDQRILDYVLESNGTVELARHRAESQLRLMGLDGQRKLSSLSGGEGRRAALARALARDPDVLLLDEPTNHLDLPAIEWLEEMLSGFAGALFVVSHDRRFLGALARSVVWLDRGRVRRLDREFGQFEAWADKLEDEEAQSRHLLERRIKREERWLSRGVTARRKRNQGRLTRLQEMRARRARWLGAPGMVKLDIGEAERSGSLVIEAKALAKSFDQEGRPALPVIRDFSTIVRRGDRIGIIGPNGAGKTTLIRLLTGALHPDSGRVRLGSNLSICTFDQRRESLDPELTLWQTLVPGGGDSLQVAGRQRHVVSYLRDFLFDEGQARQPVRSLSGGEKNRLLLARLFARPSNLLVMDEPTNDLDMETLDLLVEVLDDYEGCLLLVSHDRDFLDRLVTSIIAVEGDGMIQEYAGGYSDYLRQRPPAEPSRAANRGTPPRTRERRARPAAGKLSYKDARELERLPEEIESLSTELGELEGRMADSDLYASDPRAFGAATSRLELVKAALAAKEERWLTLEELREGLTGGSGPEA